MSTEKKKKRTQTTFINPPIVRCIHMYTSEKDFPHGEPWWKENSKVLHKIFHLNGGRRGPPTKVSRWTPTSTNTQTTANVPLVWHRHTHADPKKTISWMGQSQRWDNPTMGQSLGTITPQWDYPNNDIDQPSWHLLKWDNMFINQSCQPPWQLRTLQSDKGEIILQDQMIGKNKKVAHFCPPLKEGGLSQSSTMKKSSKKCPSSNPTSEHGFPRKYYPHFHRSRPGKTLTDGKNIFSKNHVQIQQGNKHKK